MSAPSNPTYRAPGIRSARYRPVGAEDLALDHHRRHQTPVNKDEVKADAALLASAISKAPRRLARFI